MPDRRTSPPLVSAEQPARVSVLTPRPGFLFAIQISEFECNGPVSSVDLRGTMNFDLFADLKAHQIFADFQWT